MALLAASTAESLQRTRDNVLLDSGYCRKFGFPPLFQPPVGGLRCKASQESSTTRALAGSVSTPKTVAAVDRHRVYVGGPQNLTKR
jgi:hypothetical protein